MDSEQNTLMEFVKVMVSEIIEAIEKDMGK